MSGRQVWVSYLRVSTAAQAEHDLSIPAQRRAITEYAERNGHAIAHEYVEAGCSGRSAHRKAFRQMLEDAFRPDSDLAAIVVHHTSRFSRDATQARVVKSKLHKIGVRVLSVTQDLHDDPFGQLIEGVFECIDQYESEVNGVRVSAAMREAMKQGYCPAPLAPYGFMRVQVEAHPGVMRYVLVPDEREASIVRELVQLYVAHGGAKTVARLLNQRGRFHRGGKRWNKDLVYRVLDEEAIAGTYYWAKRENRTKRQRPPEEWSSLKVEPIVDAEMHALALRLRAQREPPRNPGKPPPPDLLLARMLRCGKCGASYRLETSGKGADTGTYKYRYYNCRTACRVGKEACPGGRITTSELDQAVAEHLADVICTDERAEMLVQALQSQVLDERRQRAEDQRQRAVSDLEQRFSAWQRVAARSEPHRALAERRLAELHAYQKELQQPQPDAVTPAAEIERARREAVTPTTEPVACATDRETIEQIRNAWRDLVLSGSEITRNYLLHLVDRIEIVDRRVTIVPRLPLVEDQKGAAHDSLTCVGT